MNSKVLTFDQIFDVLIDGILIFDQNGNLVKFNQTAENLLQRLIPDCVVLTFQDILDIFELPEFPQSGTMDKHSRTLHEVTVSIIRKKVPLDGNSAMIVYLQENTGQKKQFTKIQKQTYDLLWKIRSRLTPVQNALSLLDEYGDLDASERKELLKGANVELAYLERYLYVYRDLTLLSVNALSAVMKLENVNIAECIDCALKNTEHYQSYLSKSRTVSQNIASARPIRSDKQRTIWMLESIILNAMIYSPDPAIIKINVWDNELGVHCTVEDQGFGIAARDQPSVFTYMHRGTNTHKTDYNGLGCELFLSRNLMIILNGELSFQSNEKIGTVFKLTFPAGETNSLSTD
ncbi:MAG: PAS domain-containing sensor histidine kinase [Chitinivibrionales bacterium]|nr:PAS domain-containing sensor histidine kinase [Chitinivibrionales bacterium]